jgi:hypothetical protein
MFSGAWLNAGPVAKRTEARVMMEIKDRFFILISPCIGEG